MKHIPLQNQKTRTLAMTGLFSALICVLAPVALPIGPVPITLATFIIYLSIFVLDTKQSLMCCLLYLLLGLVGLPVFSGFTGGIGKLIGPTGGYLIGYLPLILVSSLIIKKNKHNHLISAIALILGTAVLYFIGTAWFVIQQDMSWSNSLALCVFPFLFGDAIKILLAIFIGPVLQVRLSMLYNN